MMLGVLEQYRKNEKRVEEREICRRFTDAMTERQKAVRVLWHTADCRSHAVMELFGFQAALESALAVLSAQCDNLTAQQSETESVLHRIGWEEASERYWNAKVSAEQAAEAIRQAQELLSQCKESIKLQKQTQSRMQAAKYAARVSQAENEAAAIGAQILEKEQNTDAKQLTVLGASVRRILETELPVMRDNVTRLQAEADAANTALQQAQMQQEASERTAKEARSVSDMADMAMGTSQMLSCMEERIHDLNSELDVTCFGQEFNPSTFAIAKADMMIRGAEPQQHCSYRIALRSDCRNGYEI